MSLIERALQSSYLKGITDQGASAEEKAVRLRRLESLARSFGVNIGQRSQRKRRVP